MRLVMKLASLNIKNKFNKDRSPPSHQASAFAEATADRTEGKEEKMAEVICAWCNDLIGFNSSSSGITHGICQSCYEKELEKLKNISEEKKLELRQLDDDENEK